MLGSQRQITDTQSIIVSMESNWNILNWNIRGINDREKWLALNNKISDTKCDIICNQETKREQFDQKYIHQFCTRSFNKYDYLPSIGASGGIITIWKGALFQGETLFKNEFSLSIRFTSTQSGEQWILTNIYGPCQLDKRIEFLNRFQDIDMPCETKWIIMGDFNYIRYPSNRNREGGNFNDMMNFNDAINRLALIEIPLKGKNYTWSNMQDAPLLQKLDWYLHLKLGLELFLKLGLYLLPDQFLIIPLALYRLVHAYLGPRYSDLRIFG